MSRQRLSVAFDGVLHDGIMSFAPVIGGEPVPGAKAWLARARNVFDVSICTPRAQHHQGAPAVRDWLSRHFGDVAEGIEIRYGGDCDILLAPEAVRFEGVFPDPGALLVLRDWRDTA